MILNNKEVKNMIEKALIREGLKEKPNINKEYIHEVVYKKTEEYLFKQKSSDNKIKKGKDNDVTEELNKLANQFYKYDENIDDMLKKSVKTDDMEDNDVEEKCNKPSYITSLPYDNRTTDPIHLSERQQAIEKEIKKTDNKIKKIETKLKKNISDLERDYKNLIINTRRIYPRSTEPSIFFDNTPPVEKAITKITNEGNKEIQDQYVNLMRHVGDLYNDMRKNLVSRETGGNYAIDPWGNKVDIYEVPSSLRTEFKLSDDYLQNPTLHGRELNIISKDINNFNKSALNHFDLNSWSSAKGDAKTIGDFSKRLMDLNKTISSIRNSSAKDNNKFQSSQKELSEQLKKKTDLEEELDKINI